jgi:Raf kinase inhibitor-like YbhB/YbcL family protein
MHNRWIVLLTIVIVFILAGGCASPSPQGPPQPSQTPSPPSPSITGTPAGPGTFVLRVANLNQGDPLPDAYTCKGASESPQITWDNVPAGTKSLILVVDDPDASKGTFTHWLVYNIPPESRELTRAQPVAKVLFNGAQQGDTSAGSRGYFPPCPPPGPAHRYIFRLYAVDTDIAQPTADSDSIDAALNGHIITQAQFVTILAR